MSYYFLIASLPSIALESQPSLTLDAFRSQCADHLSPGHLQTLSAILDDAEGDENEQTHPFARRWRARETQLRNACVRLRAAKRNVDAGTYQQPHPGFDACLEDGVDEAFSESDPMNRELALDKIRWRVLDELSGPNPFSDEVVFAYGLKLKLAERWAAHDEEKGSAKVKASLEPSEEENNTDEETK